MLRTMFSIITIASSTMKPGADRQRHQRQIVEAEAARYMTPNVAMIDSGTRRR